MDCFDRQHTARLRTSRLILLFALATGGTILGFNLFSAVIVLVVGVIRLLFALATGNLATTTINLWRSDVAIWTTVLALLVMATGALCRWRQLRTGGRAAAALVGARDLATEPASSERTRLRNVVEEMAIASGIAAPAVFVLANETAINAFIAGTDPADAVLIVTQGAVEKLSRDELQAVVGHEFSHLLNGDSRLNLRLVAALHGILLFALIGVHLAGALLDGDSDGAAILVYLLLALGAVFLGLGGFGYACGRLIQAAVSRQRECLADAAAVQFTRNPAGLLGALRKIEEHGSVLRTRRAVPFRHCCFAQAFKGWIPFLATHPSLARRLRSVEALMPDPPPGQTRPSAFGP